ncbi:MAG TPA: BatA domain-containing protein [Gemmatimonadaceae bacterium]|nr:BatA domain-containing protein [Gemmatimonadaceae bacterium]
MSFAAPLWLAVAGMVAAGLVIAHLISTSVPQRDPFPTARFVPQGAPLTVLRTQRLTDVVLLLLRLLAIAMLGLALAGAQVSRDAPTRVVLADVSRAVASASEVSDSVRALGDVPMLFAYDSVAHRVDIDSLTQLATRESVTSKASLSAALVAAHRSLSAITEGRTETELVIVSPLAREQVDSATASLVALWEGPVRVVRVAAAGSRSMDTAGDEPSALGLRPAAVEIRAVGDDPVGATLGSAVARTDAPEATAERREPSAEGSQRRAAARIVRTEPTSADSAWARRGGTLVLWPANIADSHLERRATSDTARGIAAESDVVIGDFARTHEPRAGAMMVAWLDGSAAATEAALGAGCIRDVAIPVDPVGDVALRQNFRAIVRRLVQPCGGERDFTALSDSALGLPRSASSLASPAMTGRAIVSREFLWFALAAVGFLVAEHVVRRRRVTV